MPRNCPRRQVSQAELFLIKPVPTQEESRPVFRVVRVNSQLHGAACLNPRHEGVAQAAKCPTVDQDPLDAIIIGCPGLPGPGHGRAAC